jgi:hypothetical protein
LDGENHPRRNELSFDEGGDYGVGRAVRQIPEYPVRHAADLELGLPGIHEIALDQPEGRIAAEQPGEEARKAIIIIIRIFVIIFNR